MLRIRFGKLAIAVLAVSGAAAHADIEGSSLLSKVKGSSVKVEGMLAGLMKEGDSSLPKALKLPYRDANVGGLSFESFSLTNLGPVKISAGVDFTALHSGNNSFYNAAGSVKQAKTEVQDTAAAAASGAEEAVTKGVEAVVEGANPEQTAEPKPAATTKTDADNKPVFVRAENEVNGVFTGAFGQATYDVSDSLYTSFRVTGGAVAPFNALKKFYFAGSLRGALGYKVTSSASVELAGKYMHAFDASVKPIVGLTLSGNYTY